MTGRFGVQPAHSLLVSRGRLADAAQELGVTPAALRGYLEGRNVAPAEIKLGVSELVGVDLESCWTPEMLGAVYAGPRR